MCIHYAHCTRTVHCIRVSLWAVSWRIVKNHRGSVQGNSYLVISRLQEMYCTNGQELVSVRCNILYCIHCWLLARNSMISLLCVHVASLSEMSGQSCDIWRSPLTTQSACFCLRIKGVLTHLKILVILFVFTRFLFHVFL